VGSNKREQDALNKISKSLSGAHHHEYWLSGQ
jgi:hypothetical protein